MSSDTLNATPSMLPMPHPCITDCILKRHISSMGARVSADPLTLPPFTGSATASLPPLPPRLDSFSARSANESSTPSSDMAALVGGTLAASVTGTANRGSARMLRPCSRLAGPLAFPPSPPAASTGAASYRATASVGGASGGHSVATAHTSPLAASTHATGVRVPPRMSRNALGFSNPSSPSPAPPASPATAAAAAAAPPQPAPAAAAAGTSVPAMPPKSATLAPTNAPVDTRNTAASYRYAAVSSAPPSAAAAGALAAAATVGVTTAKLSAAVMAWLPASADAGSGRGCRTYTVCVPTAHAAANRTALPAPPASAVCCVGASTRTSASLMPSHPRSWPSLLRPHAYAAPSTVVAAAWWLDSDTLATRVPAGSATRVATATTSPSFPVPHMPAELSPNDHRLPSAHTTSVVWSATATCTARAGRPGTHPNSRSRSSSSALPTVSRPHWPRALLPIVHTAPPRVMATRWLAPSATDTTNVSSTDTSAPPVAGATAAAAGAAATGSADSAVATAVAAAGASAGAAATDATAAATSTSAPPPSRIATTASGCASRHTAARSSSGDSSSDASVYANRGSSPSGFSSARSPRTCARASSSTAAPPFLPPAPLPAAALPPNREPSVLAAAAIFALLPPAPAPPPAPPAAAPPPAPPAAPPPPPPAPPSRSVTSVGVFLRAPPTRSDFLAPAHPSSPCRESVPHVYSAPPAVTAADLPSATAMSTTTRSARSPVTRFGTSTSFVLSALMSSPSWPSSAAPTAHTSPSSVRNSACLHRGAIATFTTVPPTPSYGAQPADAPTPSTPPSPVYHTEPSAPTPTLVALLVAIEVNSTGRPPTAGAGAHCGNPPAAAPAAAAGSHSALADTPSEQSVAEGGTYTGRVDSSFRRAAGAYALTASVGALQLYLRSTHLVDPTARAGSYTTPSCVTRGRRGASFPLSSFFLGGSSFLSAVAAATATGAAANPNGDGATGTAGFFLLLASAAAAAADTRASSAAATFSVAAVASLLVARATGARPKLVSSASSAARISV